MVVTEAVMAWDLVVYIVTGRWLLLGLSWSGSVVCSVTGSWLLLRLCHTHRVSVMTCSIPAPGTTTVRQHTLLAGRGG